MRETGILMSLPEFQQLMQRRIDDPTGVRLPRGFDLEFLEPATPAEQVIRDLSDRYRSVQSSRLEIEIFAQRKRLVDAERRLAVKPTKGAAEIQRIATAKVQQLLAKLALLKDSRPDANDYRIFPRSYAPIVVVREGRKMLVPARYLLRQPGAAAFMDDKLAGNYNARRDNLTRFWRRQFGVTHGVMVIDSFYENVTGADGRNQVLHFVPRPPGRMFIACLFGEWVAPNGADRLLSFAAITDEPPAEVAAAGHDRMIVNLRPENIDRWLTPEGRSIDELQSILSDRQTPFYEHSLAA